MHDQCILTRNQAKALDACAINTYGIPGIVLMENAGRGIIDVFLTYQPHKKIVICCGKGNNGGDGFVVARYLHNLNFHVQILVFSDPSTIQGDAKINYDIAVKLNIPITIMHTQHIDVMTPILSDADWVIDALFGTGLQGMVQAPFDKVIDLINQSHNNVLSIDIPSGLDCDTGKPLGHAVKATITTTMIGPKQGFSHPSAKQYLGEVHAIEIGIPNACIQTLVS